MKKTLIIILFILIVFFLASLDNKLEGPYYVVRVIDGDTFVVRINDENIRIRLIGVDAPESVHVDKTKNTEEGKKAALFLKKLIENKKVYLEYDIKRKDKYGRTLAYAYLDDEMINLILIREKNAEILFISPNYKYEDKFIEEYNR